MPGLGGRDIINALGCSTGMNLYDHSPQRRQECIERHIGVKPSSISVRYCHSREGGNPVCLCHRAQSA
jgi:hypothetical protein